MDAFFSGRTESLLSRFSGLDDEPPVFSAEAEKTGGRRGPSDLSQYSGIQVPKNQKPHPPKTGLKIGVALYPLYANGPKSRCA